MEGLERAGGCRPSVQTSLSAGPGCNYGMGRFLPRSTPFSDCMQGMGGYPSYPTDWNLMQGMYSHPSLPMDRGGSSYRSSSSAYYPVTHSNKDLGVSAGYPTHHSSLSRSYESVNNGGYNSPLCAPTSPSPSSTRMSPDLDKKENRGKFSCQLNCCEGKLYVHKISHFLGLSKATMPATKHLNRHTIEQSKNQPVN